jgi:ribose transport system permease protein
VSVTSRAGERSAGPAPGRGGPGTGRSRERVVALLQRNAAAVVLAGVVLVAAAAFPAFASGDNLRNIAVQVSFLALIALGQTFVILTGGIDLSVGSVYVLGGVLAAWGSQWGLAGALALPLAVCGLVGLGNGLLVGWARLAPFIVTLASLLGVRGLMLAITDEGARTYLVVDVPAFTWLGQGTVLTIGVPVVIAVACFAAGWVLLNRTRFGVRVLAVGGSEAAARLMGAPVGRVKVQVYVLSALLAGLAGTLNAARSSSGVTIIGVGLELDAIAAVVLGGTLLTGGAGTVLGTLVGVLLLGVVQNIVNQVGTLDANVQSAVSGAFLVVVVVVQAVVARRRRR